MSNSDEIRWMQRLENFSTALRQLDQACEQASYTNLERAGLVQTFMFSHELAWKVLKDLQAAGRRSPTGRRHRHKSQGAGVRVRQIMSIDTAFLRRCTRTLDLALDEIGKHREADDILYDIFRAACVKEFELLFYDGYDLNSPREVIRQAFISGYLDEEDCEAFLDALGKRNTLSHVYRKEMALEAEALIKRRYHPMLRRLHVTLHAKAGQ